MKHFQWHTQPERFATPRGEGAFAGLVNVPFFASEFSGLQRTFRPRKLASILRCCGGTTAVFVPGPTLQQLGYDCHHLGYDEDCLQCNTRLLQQRSERQWKHWSWIERPYSLTPLEVQDGLSFEIPALLEGCADQTARDIGSWVLGVNSNAARRLISRHPSVPGLHALIDSRGTLALPDDDGSSDDGGNSINNELSSQVVQAFTRAAAHGSQRAPWFSPIDLQQAFAIQHGWDDVRNGLRPNGPCAYTSWLIVY